jgi:hypothetical protein
MRGPPEMTCSTPSCRIRRADAAAASSADTPGGAPPDPASRQIFGRSFGSSATRFSSAPACAVRNAGSASAASPAVFSIFRRDGVALIRAY